MHRTTELSLFTGAGGGVLASILLGHRVIGYVEIEEYCQKIIRQRIKDGIFDDAPIFSDIREFNRDYAAAYTGLVDVVSGGFPCQPFSVAGKRAGAGDERNMWPATIETIRLVRPRYAFLENSPTINVSEYFWKTIIPELYDWIYDEGGGVIVADVFDAEKYGAPINRVRLYILAIANGEHGQKGLGNFSDWQKALFRDKTKKRIGLWIQTPSRNSGMGNGISDYSHRVKAIGNGQIPLVAACAFAELRGQIE